MTFKGLETLLNTTDTKLGFAMEKAIQPLCDVRDAEPDGNKRSDLMRDILPGVIKNLTSVMADYYKVPFAIKDYPNSQDAYFLPRFKYGSRLEKTLTDRWYQKTSIKTNTADGLSKLNDSLLHDIYLDNPDLDDKDVLAGFSFDVVIDFVGFLNSSEEITVGIEDFTAAEVVAFILHEFGHFISMCKRFSQTKLSLRVAKEHYSYFLKYAEPEEKKKFIDHQIKMFGEDKYIPKEHLELAQKIAIVEKEVKSSILDIPGDVLRNILYTIGVLVIVGNNILDSILEMVITKGFTNSLLEIASIRYQKDDDYLSNNRQMSLKETEADSYAAHHGYGGALSSGLSKLQQAGRLTMFFTKGARQSKYLYYLSTFVDATVTTITNEEDMTGLYTYEPLVARLTTIRSETVKCLKDAKLPREISNKYLSQLDEIERNIKAAKTKHMLPGIINSLISVIAYINPIYFVTAAGFLLFTNKTPGMGKLLKQIELLKNNDIYVASAKFSSMLERKQ